MFAAPSAGGEPAHSSEGSMPSADAARALGGRFGWTYWPEGGQRQHHCRARRVVACCGGLSKIAPRGRRPLKIAQCSGTGVVISDATTLGELLIPLLNWSITGQEWGEDGESKRVRTLKRRSRLRVTARLFSLFVRDRIS